MYRKNREKDSICPLVKEGTLASTSIYVFTRHAEAVGITVLFFNIVIYQGVGLYTYTYEGYMINVALSEENAPFKGTG